MLVNKSYNLAKDIYTPENTSKILIGYIFGLRNFVEILEHFLTILLPSIFFYFF